MPANFDSIFEIASHPSLNDCLHKYKDKFDDKLTQDQREKLLGILDDEPTIASQFQRVLIGSDYAANYLADHPDVIFGILADERVEKNLSLKDFQHKFEEFIGNELDEEVWFKKLRIFRHLMTIRSIWRDLNRLADTVEITRELSYFAEAVIEKALQYNYDRATAEFGIPRNKAGEQQAMLVIAMGKLGAWELNLSSDIDLIFCYPQDGETDITDCEKATKKLTNQEFFIRVGQRFIKMLDAQTADGFVFRVDMRLRPYGQSGALVSQFDSLEVYYHAQGREWERFAMVKARVVANTGEPALVDKLMHLLNEFTYRRYVDFSAIEALRQMKLMIQREEVRRGLSENVKLGPGGIREVEFIAQAFQVIRGGKDIELQNRRLIGTLNTLPKLGCIPQGADEQLIKAYCFLRDTEHAIQAYRDRQTQQLPTDELARLRLAISMGFASWEAFYTKLKHYRDQVNQHFNAVISTPEHENGEDADVLADWQHVWQAREWRSDLMEGRTISDPDVFQQALTSLWEKPQLIAADKLSKERLDQLMPRLLSLIEKTQAPGATFSRLLDLITAIARRSAYIVLLIENPNALKQLVKLSEASPWVAIQLAEHPALLDELLDATSLYSVPTRDQLENELRQQLMRIPNTDIEALMEGLRYFRSAHAMQVAACEISGALPLMKVSDYLTQIAEVILDYVLNLAWEQMVERHGYPDKFETTEPQLLIVGYGKLGGIELGHGSDLDLVFVHNSSSQGMTSGDFEGKRAIENDVFFARLGQKIIHILNTKTLSGQLYEVDMRLRPSGSSGLLVSRVASFEKYQRENAWTWEHQALLRARAIVGPQPISEAFDEIRLKVLTRERERDKLVQEVREMRKKMRDHLGSSERERAAGQFHLKQDAGGIVDIEFMVQYIALAWAHRYPALIHYTDNIRILGCVAESGLLETQKVTQLIEAYKAFRSMGHRLALQHKSGVVDGALFASERDAVKQLWSELLGETNA